VTAGDPYLTLAFSLASSADAYAVLVGAGVSKGAGLPSAWDIEVDLVRQIAQRDNASVAINNDNAEQWYSDHYHRALTYSSVVEELARTPHERQALLQKYFEVVDTDDNSAPVPPSAAHHAIARLVEAGIVRVIITMNFDRLFELALIEPLRVRVS
jgi:NAD-dependent SIR2 family protein deacetylase